MRQYRLLEIATQYDEYLRKFYGSCGDIGGLSYDELFKILADDAFAESDFMHRHLNKMGIESKVVFCNNRNLQDKWRPSLKGMPYFDILLMQIKDFMPDVILISAMKDFADKEIAAMKESAGGKIKLAGFHFSPLTDAFKKNAGLYDQIYTGNDVYVKAMRDLGLPAFLLRHAFEPDIIGRIPACGRRNEVCFPGSIMLGGGGFHDNRLDMLDAMASSGVPHAFYGGIYGSVQEILGREDGIRRLEMISRAARNMKEPVFGMEYFSVLSQYGICLNINAGGAEGGGGNMRTYEATGMGACLLTDSRADGAGLFDAGSEIVEYDSFGDMAEKAKWLLGHPEAAREIALAGQRKTFSRYTYRNKAEHLDGYIQKLLE